MFQDFLPINILSSTVLTNSFIPGTVISAFNSNPALRNQLNLLVTFVKSSLTSLNVKVEYSNDGSNYYQETFESIATGVATMTQGLYSFAASGSYVVSIPIKASYIRVSAQGVGSVGTDTVFIDGALGTV